MVLAETLSIVTRATIFLFTAPLFRSDQPITIAPGKYSSFISKVA